ncbi:MAG: hypothetical protein R3B89_16905 [Polyangiaceae bacterium]
MKASPRGGSGSAAWSRRRFVGACLAASAGLTLTRVAEASLARAISLETLVRTSHHVVFATPVESSSRWEQIAGRKRIVTYTRLLVSESMGAIAPDESELMVRTLGGQVGDIGQIVHGEAELALNRPSVLFVGLASQGPLFIQAMSQGEYPTREHQGEPQLRLSPRLSEIDADARSAVRLLNERQLSAARKLIQEVSR